MIPWAMAARERGILMPVRIDETPIPLPFGLIQTFLHCDQFRALQYGTPAEAAGAWFVVLVLGLVPLIALGLIRGMREANRFGPPPA